MNFPTSQTPPPPSPYPTTPSPAPEPAGPGLSEGQRLIDVFIAPTKTFTDLKRNPSWWVPWLISAILLVLSALVIIQKGDIPRLVEHRMERSKFGQQRMSQLSPAQKEQAMNLQATIYKVTLFIRPVFALLGGLIGAAILMAIFNFMLGAEVPFQRAMAVFFYASLPGLIKLVLLCITFLVSSDPSGIDPDINPVATNPAFFMDPESSKFLYFLASGVDVLGIWVATLLGIGFATASSNGKPSRGTGLITAYVLYAILVVGGAAVASMF
jgi:hypothetical protein